jgi:cobalt-zinc-cadmium efflux system protein
MAADALVSLGVVVAGALALLHGWLWLDPVISLLVALVIVIGSGRLFLQSAHLLFDGVPPTIDLRAVRAHLEILPGVTRVHDLHIRAMSTSEIALTAQIIIPAGHPGDDFLEKLVAQLRDRFDITHATIQIMRHPSGESCDPATGALQSCTEGMRD